MKPKKERSETISIIDQWKKARFPVALEIELQIRSAELDWEKVIRTYQDTGDDEAVRIARTAQKSARDMGKALIHMMKENEKIQEQVLSATPVMGDLEELRKNHPLKWAFVVRALRNARIHRLRKRK